MDISFLTKEWLVSIRQKLIRFFAAERCLDPDNCADETIFRVVKAISKGTAIYVKPESYIYGVAKLVEKECRRRRIKIKESQIDETTPEPALPDDAAEVALHLCLEKGLRKLSPFERALIVQYYGGKKSGDDKQNRKALADRLTMSIQSLRKEAMKIRQKLECSIAAFLGH